MSDEEVEYPPGSADEREMLLQYLDYGRGAILRNVEGLDDEQARWTPDGKLIPLIGIVNHLTKVEWRWIDGGFAGADASRSEKEFYPGPDLKLDAAVAAYRARAAATNDATRGN